MKCNKAPYFQLSARQSRAGLVAYLALAVFACNVESTDTGNKPVDLRDDEEQDAGPGADDDAGVTKPPAPKGFVVVHTDYASASVSVLDVNGEVLSESLVSSGSQSPGISLALGGDVVVPTLGLSGEVVLIDRDNNVIDWVDLETATVEQQVGVGPGGFDANPYDYAQWDKTKAFVPRWESNAQPGEAELDEGGDLLIVDPSTGELTGRIDLAPTLGEDADDFLPRPDSTLIVGDKLYVLVVGMVADNSSFTDSRLVTVDPESNEVLDVLVFEGMRNCGEMAVSADHKSLAASCWGDWAEFAGAGIVTVDISADKPSEADRYLAQDLTGSQPNSVAFSAPQRLVFTTYGNMDLEGNVLANDGLYELNLASGEVGEPVFEASPFMLTDVRCVPGACALTDGESEGGVVQFLSLDDDGVVDDVRAVRVTGNSLPPRYLGTF